MFNHVTDERLRSILEKTDTTEDEMLYLLHETEAAVDADAEDEDVPGDAVEHRVNAFWEAFNAWEDDRDAARCMAALRECWSA